MKIGKISGGLAGKILRVDLTNKKIWTEETEKYAQRWLGGRAIASWILLEETSPDIKWSDPDNLLIFSPGCLVGTYSPGACRTSVDSISAFNNGKGSANFGGHFGPELKYAGFDHVVITGKSATPVYLWIQDGKAEIRGAGSLRGKLTDETEEILQRELGDDRVSVASIGPAGENLVRGAAVFGDCGQAAGGSGVGCVMGDKKLKAIAVRGHGSIKIAEPERFFKAVEVAREKIENSLSIMGEGGFASMRHGGIIVAFKYGDKPSTRAPIRNGQDEYWPQERNKGLVGEDMGVPKYYTRMWSCFGCPIGCQPFLEINEGKYKGTQGFAYWANSMGYSKRVDSDDPATSAKFQMLTNQLGLDSDDAIVAISWAFECYEKGLLTKQDTDDLELEWGNDNAWIKLTENIAYRKGLGNLLADGVLIASRKLGKGSEKFAIHCKQQDSFDGMRGVALGYALGVATSPVAGRHLRGASGQGTSGPAIIGTILPIELDNQSEAVFWQLRTKEIDDITGTCVAVIPGEHIRGGPHFCHFINSALGTNLTPEELMDLGESSYNLEKAFNTLHTDFNRKDDYPPERYMKEPIKSGPLSGVRIDKGLYDQMLDRFYELLVWDKVTGLQTRRCLNRLGLQDVAKKLSKAGKL
ncbi:aldehyde ferredoxin oxidoreductase family protein [Chloroflexota bacterium]